MNSKTSSVGKTYENEFSEFLIKRIGNAGGSLQLQHITGHLSQVRSEVRNAIGSSKSDLVQFLKKHDNLFSIENNNVVSLVKFAAFDNTGSDSDTSSIKSYSNLPSMIQNGKGVIVKIFSNYGFIKSKEPIKTEIFFNSFCFGSKNIDLTSFLHVGAIVFFNARRKPVIEKNICKYDALKVWRVDNSDENNLIIQKSRKSRDTGLYDPLNLESEGIIQNIFPNLGFISVKGDNNNTVFFHKNRVVNYDNIVDLTKVFSRGDSVEFTAHRSSKPDAKARWEATKVWKVSGKIKENASHSGSSQLSLPNQRVSNLTKAPEMIKDQCGKIYPRSHGAVIKFGKNELADGDSALYYVCGTQVTEIGWEFSEGDDIYFDAVKIKSAPGWKAVLVWSGKKPDIVLPVNLGDYSEFTEDDDNGDVNNSIYTSKSSLCISEGSDSSFKSEKFSSKTKTLKKQIQKLSDSSSDKDVAKKLSKDNRTSSRESLNSLPHSDKYCLSDKKSRNLDEILSKNHNSSSKNSLSSLTASEQHNLKSSKKMVNLSSHKSVNMLDKVVSNWVESENLVDEAYESMETSKSLKSNILLKQDREIEHSTDDEMEDSSEYASADDDEVDKNISLEHEALSENSSLKCAASIKKYRDMDGEVYKVFSRFAEVKSTILPETISFSLNDFYLKGTPVDELADDLKSVLEVNEIIKINFFEIIDDSGTSWKKVTLAWKGIKPGYLDEISPEDFIKQNNLSVTINNDFDDNEIIDKVFQKKFLTSFEDISNNSIDNLSKTESYSEEELLTLSPKSQAHSKIDLPDDSECLSDAVYRILERDMLPKNPTVDIKSVSEEIINILQNHTNKTNALLSDISSEERYISGSLENSCLKCKERNLSLKNCFERTNSTTQTIVTGEIISQNILPDC